MPKSPSCRFPRHIGRRDATWSFLRYQIVAGYEDANDADRLRHDSLLQIVADQKLGDTLGSQPTLSRWENAPSARDLVRLNHALLDLMYNTSEADGSLVPVLAQRRR